MKGLNKMSRIEVVVLFLGMSAAFLIVGVIASVMSTGYNGIMKEAVRAIALVFLLLSFLSNAIVAKLAFRDVGVVNIMVGALSAFFACSLYF